MAWTMKSRKFYDFCFVAEHIPEENVYYERKMVSAVNSLTNCAVQRQKQERLEMNRLKEFLASSDIITFLKCH